MCVILRRFLEDKYQARSLLAFSYLIFTLMSLIKFVPIEANLAPVEAMNIKRRYERPIFKEPFKTSSGSILNP